MRQSIQPSRWARSADALGIPRRSSTGTVASAGAGPRDGDGASPSLPGTGAHPPTSPAAELVGSHAVRPAGVATTSNATAMGSSPALSSIHARRGAAVLRTTSREPWLIPARSGSSPTQTGSSSSAPREWTGTVTQEGPSAMPARSAAASTSAGAGTRPSSMRSHFRQTYQPASDTNRGYGSAVPGTSTMTGGGPPNDMPQYGAGTATTRASHASVPTAGSGMRSSRRARPRPSAGSIVHVSSPTWTTADPPNPRAA